MMATVSYVDNCLKKKVYVNERVALLAAKKAERRSGILHEPYECPVCFNWHLTTGEFVGNGRK